jgi:ribosomal protein S18 acetylase RimI-like enzyme
MRLLNTIAGVEYGVLESAELPAMTHLLADVFSRFDPPAVAIGLPYTQVHGLVAAFGPQALAQQLSIVALEASSGALVGALLVGDFATPPPEGVLEAAPAFEPIGALLDSLDERYRANYVVAQGSHLHLFMLGVAEQASGRGIAHNLIATCLSNGRLKGYSTAITEATGSVSQHVFGKLGFSELLVASYSDFSFRGEHVFSNIHGPRGTALMIRAL